METEIEYLQSFELLERVSRLNRQLLNSVEAYEKSSEIRRNEKLKKRRFE